MNVPNIFSSLRELLSSWKDLLSSRSKLLSSRRDLLSSCSKLLSSRSKLLSSRRDLLSSWKDLLSSRRDLLSSRRDLRHPSARNFFAVSVVLLVLTFTSCTKKFEEINTDPTQFTELTPAIIPQAFAKAEYQGIYADPGIYQLVRNLFVDYWSQYYATVDPGVPTDRYVLRADWVFYQWGSHYASTWPTLKQVIEATEGRDAPANAIAKIWKAYIFHVTTDFYGPVPYFQAGSGDLSIPYDSQESIYDDMLKTIDTAVTVLKTVDQSIKPFGTSDLIYAGDIPKWIRFGNTLRLRLAMRISGVLPDRAKTEAEKAVASGVLESDDDNALMQVATASPNGLNLMAPWGGFRMSASMESYLKGFDDPRMPQYFSPAISDGEYHGARNGLSSSQIAASPKNQYDNLSNIGPRFNVDDAATNKLAVIYTAEAYFLRAEGAVNGWNMGGTAKSLYEQGIAASMRMWGVTNAADIAAYTNGTGTPTALTDYLNSPAVASIPVLFAADEAT
ncbi:MAG: SusD/RagB family nutrient-binding outer membrane lipoprotein, partial [Chitinophagaceae bacterium]